MSSPSRVPVRRSSCTSSAADRVATIASPITDWPYGERQAAIDDIFGHQWVVTQTLVDTAPEQWGGKTITPR